MVTVYSQTALSNQAHTFKLADSSNHQELPQSSAHPMKRKSYQSSVTTKRCACCDDIFHPTRKTQLYCSPACRQKQFRLNQMDKQTVNGKYCVRCNERLTGRQRKYCSNTCKQLTHRAKKRATVHQYQQLGIKLDTVLDSIELIGMSKSAMALQQLGYTYSIADKAWQGRY